MEAAAPVISEHNEILDRWIVKRQLAKGTFSTVSKVVSKQFATDRKCLKVILTDKSLITAEELFVLRKSFDVLDNVSHRYLVRLRERCETKEGIFMIFDLVTGGTLFDRIAKRGKLSEREAAKVLCQVSSALQYLHSKNIIYRDLKAEHILLTEAGDDYDCVLSGSDVVVRSETPISEYAGTPGYVAPEVLKRQPFHCAVDMWSLGVTFFTVLCGYAPFDAGDDTVQDIHLKSMKGHYSMEAETWDKVSKEAKALVKRLLTVDPKNRITATEVFTHPWVQKFDGQLGYFPPLSSAAGE